MVRKILRLRVILLALCVSLLAFNTAFSPCLGETGEYEIKYDDGNFEARFRWVTVSRGRMLAVRFTPSDTPVRLEKARFYIDSSPNPFIVRVFDNNRNSLLEKSVQPDSKGWFTVELSGFNIILNGDFYIAMESDPSASENPYLGGDDTNPNDRSYWVSPNEGWVLTKDEAREIGISWWNVDFGIRAVVLPVNSIEIDLNPKVGSVVVDGTTYDAYRLPVTLYFPRGSTHAIRISREVVQMDGGTRYVFNGWSDGPTEPSRSITVSSNLMITGLWKKQYLLNVTSEQGSPTGGGWYDEGSTASMFLPSTIEPGSRMNERFVFTGWSGDVQSTSTSASINMNGPKRVYANWKKQYYIRVFSQLSSFNVESDWYDEGSTLTVRLKETTMGFLIQDVFDHFEGVGPRDTIIGNGVLHVYVDGPKEIVAVWKKDYTQLIIVVAVLLVLVIGIAVLKMLKKKPEKKEAHYPPPPQPPPPPLPYMPRC